MVEWVDIEKSHVERTTSNGDLQNDLSKVNSEAPTLNNTPCVSRNSSPSRKDTSEVPSPVSGHQKDMHRHSKGRKISRYTNHELDIAWMGAVIVTCFFTSGLIDAVAFNSWNCFVGMQTGNTIFAALGLGGLPASAHELQYVKSFTAIGSFCVGTLFFNTLHRFPTGLHNQPSSRRRIIFALSFLVQTLLIIVAAGLVTVGVVSNKPFIVGTFSSGSQRDGEVEPDHRNYQDLIPIVLLAFEASGQVCLSRVLSVIELPTIVLSTLYHDWTADNLCTRQLWRQSSSVKDFVFVQACRQNKRIASIIALFLGGVVGGEMYKSQAQMAGALWLAASLKACITIAFCVWKREKADPEDSEK